MNRHRISRDSISLEPAGNSAGSLVSGPFAARVPPRDGFTASPESRLPPLIPYNQEESPLQHSGTPGLTTIFLPECHPVSNGIGTLNEGPLHQALKARYLTDGAREEVPLGSYVADVHAADSVIYEIQTGGFAPLKRKLASLIETHQVVLVHPVAAVRYIVKLAEDVDEPASRRRSPKRGSLASIVEELVSIPHLLDHPNFQVEVVLIEEDEIRVYDPGRVRGRRGWRVVSRKLNRVLETQRIRCREDLFSLVHGPLPEEFTTADLADAMAAPRWLAQKLAYCLRESGAAVLCGKTGNALRYRRQPAANG